MKSLQCTALAFGLALILGLTDSTQAQDQKQDTRRIQLPFGRGGSGPLVSKEAQEKLNLTAEQKDKIEKIEKEFADKNKDSETKLRDAREKAFKDKDREALQKLSEMAKDVQKVRSDYVDKVKAVLNDEQKKNFDEATRAGRRPGAIQPGQVRPFGRGGNQDLQSKDVQEKLNLTKEQVEKLEALKKEFEQKTQGVLTDEQKKKFEELKQQQPQIRPIRRPAVEKN